MTNAATKLCKSWGQQERICSDYTSEENKFISVKCLGWCLGGESTLSPALQQQLQGVDGLLPRMNPSVCPGAAATLSSLSSGLALPWWASTTVTQEGGEFNPWNNSLYLSTPGVLHSTNGPVVRPKML